MRKAIGGAFLFLAVLIFLGMVIHSVGVSTINQSSTGNRESDSALDPSIAPPIQVSASKLFIDYQANEVAADNIYKGKRLAVRGTVQSINKDITDDIYLVLATPNEFMGIHANVNSEEASKAAALSKGTHLTVVCQGQGMILGSPMLGDCSIQHETEENPAETAPQSGWIVPPVPEEPARSLPPPQEEETQASDAERIYRVGGAVRPPELISTGETESSVATESRRHKASETVDIVIDPQGNPRQVKVVHSLGRELDEGALSAARLYRFRPATLKGLPVSVEVNVEVAFGIN